MRIVPWIVVHLWIFFSKFFDFDVDYSNPEYFVFLIGTLLRNSRNLSNFDLCTADQKAYIVHASIVKQLNSAV